MDKKKKPVHSDSDDSEDDVVEEIQVKTRNPKQQRTSISAEVYGEWNKKGDFKPKVISKTPEVQKRIQQRMREAFMFNPLDDKEREIVMLAMQEKTVKKGEWIIRQGEEGNVLYVVDSGELDCFKKYSDKPEQQYLKTYVPGESFGELALLYNAPRAASVQAKTDAVLWELDRETFNHIVKDASVKKREKYEEFLKSWPLLKSIDDPYEKTKIADVIEIVQQVPKSQAVITRGDAQGDVYIIEEGEVAGLDSDGNMRFKLGKSDHFGEVPIIFPGKKQPLTFVVNANGTKLLKISQQSYKSTLRAVEGILIENARKKYTDLL